MCKFTLRSGKGARKIASLFVLLFYFSFFVNAGCSSYSPLKKQTLKNENKTSSQYPNLETRTGIGRFFYLYFVETASYWWAGNGVSYHKCTYKLIDGGQYKNWKWKVYATNAIGVNYSSYKRSGNPTWMQMIKKLRNTFGDVFGEKLPQLNFNLYMGAMSCKNDRSWHYVSTGKIFLNYLFPFSEMTKSLDHNLMEKEMIYASGYLSHETALALLMLRRIRDSHSIWAPGASPTEMDYYESFATLINIYFSMEYANSSPHYRTFLVPPTIYNLSFKKYRKKNINDRAEILGEQISGIKLRRIASKANLICGNNKAQIKQYKILLRHFAKENKVKLSLKLNAIRSLSHQYKRNQLILGSKYGSYKISISKTNKIGSMHTYSRLGGVFWVYIGSKNSNIRQSAKALRNKNIYLKLCAGS